MTFLKAALLPLLPALLIGCGGKADHEKEARLKAQADSLAADSAARAEVQRMLPDTAYKSVERLTYKVDVFDTATAGRLADLADLYAAAPGILTFRGGPARQARFGGRVKGTPRTIRVDWEFTTDYDGRQTKVGTWGGGSGWTGQPLYVEWPDSCVARFRSEGVLTTDFDPQEIIVGSLASKVYFLNFKTGKASRRAIDVENPVKGTVSLDPTLNGNLYVGQGVPAVRPFGALVADLHRHAVTHTFAEDRNAWRGWGAYDSSPVRVGQFLFRPGENGTLYKFTVVPGGLKLHSTLRYTKDGRAPGMEASMAVYHNYGYTADNHGNILCVNLNTMRPVWCYTNHDDTDATPVVSVENGKPYLYSGCEVDRQGSGSAYFVKLDALTGARIWETATPGRRVDIGGKHFDGGFYATPLLGEGNCEAYIFANCVANTRNQNGELLAIRRSTGEVAYRVSLKHYAWSSPVAFLNEKGEMFLFTADTFGYVYLIDGADGRILHTARVGSNFESSPVAVGNSVVVGSRGQSIFKMSIQ